MACGPFTRTAGFYKNHPAITQQIITNAGGLTVCGHPITDVDIDHGHSALEAMCVSPHGDQRVQLIRQLTAAALNLNSGSTATFSNFASCNAVCANSGSSESAISSCVSQTDAFNQSGDSLPAEFDDDCGDDDDFPGPPGPADPNPCKAAGDTPCILTSTSLCAVP